MPAAIKKPAPPARRPQAMPTPAPRDFANSTPNMMRLEAWVPRALRTDFDAICAQTRVKISAFVTEGLEIVKAFDGDLNLLRRVIAAGKSALAQPHPAPAPR